MDLNPYVASRLAEASVLTRSLEARLRELDGLFLTSLEQSRPVHLESFRAVDSPLSDAVLRSARVTDSSAPVEQCASEEWNTAENNLALDTLIGGLRAGAENAVQEYVAIVLANWIYPDWLTILHSANFDSDSGVLVLQVCVPGPNAIPSVKAYKYVKTFDQISEVVAPTRERRERYAGLVQNVALRSLWEVFTADSRALIREVCLEISTAPRASLRRGRNCTLLEVSVSRDKFFSLEIAALSPKVALADLDAAVVEDLFK